MKAVKAASPIVEYETEQCECPLCRGQRKFKTKYGFQIACDVCHGTGRVIKFV